MVRLAAVAMIAGIGLAGCATTPRLPPAEAIRYHLGPETVARGTVAVQPLEFTPGAGAEPSLEYRSYADAVRNELLRNGYTLAPAGTQPDYLATVAFRRGTREGPPRQSPFSVGVGVGGADFGRRSAVGGGVGVGFPVGGSRRGQQVVVSELEVTIRRRADQSRVWEGQARAAADFDNPAAETGALAQRLARALFTDFPGQSGRTIEIE